MAYYEKLLVGILITVLAWLINGIVMFLLKRNRLSSAIVSDISYHIRDVKEGKEYLLSFFERKIKENQVIEYVPRYTKDEYVLYKCIQQDIVKLFGKHKLLKIMKFYQGFAELEVLFDGLSVDLMKWKEEKRVLNKSDVEFMNRRLTRIVKLCDIVAAKDISKLDDLPEDYRGRIEPSATVL